MKLRCVGNNDGPLRRGPTFDGLTRIVWIQCLRERIESHPPRTSLLVGCGCRLIDDLDVSKAAALQPGRQLGDGREQPDIAHARVSIGGSERE